MIIQTQCHACLNWFHPRETTVCVDCRRELCDDCAEGTGHRIVNEPSQPWEAPWHPQPWTYRRCADTPYSIHEE